MKGWHCLFIVLVILVGVTILRADDKLKIYPPLNPMPDDVTFSKYFKGKVNFPGFTIQYNEKEKFIEVIGKNIHLRIYECGKVEKSEWKEINQNKNINGAFWIDPGNEYLPF